SMECLQQSGGSLRSAACMAMSGSNRYRLTQQPATSARYCHQLGVDRQHHTRRRQRLRNIPFCAPTHHPKYLPPTGGATPRFSPQGVGASRECSGPNPLTLGDP
ncbi:hypothetical protein PCANC_28952, partial [Puccinia coronata f. sp. avenae]